MSESQITIRASRDDIAALRSILDIAEHPALALAPTRIECRRVWHLIHSIEEGLTAENTTAGRYASSPP